MWPQDNFRKNDTSSKCHRRHAQWSRCPMTSCQEPTIARMAVKSGIFSSQRTASMVATLLLTQFPVRLAAWLAAASEQSQKAGGSTQYTAPITKHGWSLRSFLSNQNIVPYSQSLCSSKSLLPIFLGKKLCKIKTKSAEIC